MLFSFIHSFFLLTNYIWFHATYSWQINYIEREPPQMVTLMLNSIVLLALVLFICISQANSEQVDTPVSREIANNENPGMYNYSLFPSNIKEPFLSLLWFWVKTEFALILHIRYSFVESYNERILREKRWNTTISLLSRKFLSSK